jgi:hypothetical protein
LITGNWRSWRAAVPTRVCVIVLLALTTTSAPVLAAVPTQETFAAPEPAAQALIHAMRDGGTGDLAKILGPQSEEIISSGDTVADQEARATFVAAFDETHAIVSEGKNKVLLMLGAAAWPFPIPIIKTAQKWRFDAAAGREEILNRRIGRNELNAIDVCRTYVEAQAAFVHDGRADNALPEYAQQFLSAPGSHDGLYWPAGAGEEQSPLGPLVASARAEGYDPDRAGDSNADSRKPYHGYIYKILMRQGSAAPGGAHDYVVHGHMIGGFALVAFPARYGDSGVMTFIVNHDGVVYQKDLGPKTFAEANGMTAFNPEKGWEKQ